MPCFIGTVGLVGDRAMVGDRAIRNNSNCVNGCSKKKKNLTFDINYSNIDEIPKVIPSSEESLSNLQSENAKSPKITKIIDIKYT